MKASNRKPLEIGYEIETIPYIYTATRHFDHAIADAALHYEPPKSEDLAWPTKLI